MTLYVSESRNFYAQVPILVKHCDSKDNFTRLTVLTWIFEFIQLGTRVPCA